MKKQKSGNQDMPDFDSLSDRMIAGPMEGPSLVIKTNLDPSDATEENPYIPKGKADDQELRHYFDEGK